MVEMFDSLPDTCLVLIFGYLITPTYLPEASNLMTVAKKINFLIHYVITQELFYYFRIPMSAQNLSISDWPRIKIYSTIHRPVTIPQSLISLHSYYFNRSPKVALIGGVFDNRKCDILHPWSGKFQKQCSLGIKRNDDFEVIPCFPGHLMVVSGSDDSSLGVIELFNIKLNNWYLFSQMPRPLVAMSICIGSCDMSASSSSSTYLENLYVVGGVDRQDNRRTATVYHFQLQEGQLSTIGTSIDEVNKENGIVSALSISQFLQKIMIHSDQDDMLSTTTLLMMEFIEKLNRCGRWVVRDEMKLLKGRSHHCSIWFKGNLWSAGGMIEGTGFATKDVEVFDCTLQKCIPGPPMLSSRLQFKLVIIRDVLYAVGGDMMGAAHAPSGTIECYDEERQSWKFVTNFSSPNRRSRCAATAWNDRIYVFGGSDGPTNHTSWDYYDVVNGYWGTELQQRLLEGRIDQGVSHFTPWETLMLRNTDFSKVPGRLRGIKCAKAVTMNG